MKTLGTLWFIMFNWYFLLTLNFQNIFLLFLWETFLWNNILKHCNILAYVYFASSKAEFILNELNLTILRNYEILGKSPVSPLEK